MYIGTDAIVIRVSNTRKPSDLSLDMWLSIKIKLYLQPVVRFAFWFLYRFNAYSLFSFSTYVYKPWTHNNKSIFWMRHMDLRKDLLCPLVLVFFWTLNLHQCSLVLSLVFVFWISRALRSVCGTRYFLLLSFYYFFFFLQLSSTKTVVRIL